MKKLFLPAIILMNRLTYTRKFIVQLLIYLLAISVVMFNLYESLSQVSRASQRELEGIALIKSISKTVQFAQQHRGLSVGLLSGVETFRPACAEKLIETTAAINALKKQLPARLLLSGDWMRIESGWGRLGVEGLNWTVEQNFAAHTRLIDQMLDFEMDIADDEYELTIDPSIDSFYLIDTAVFKLPRALELLGQLRAYGVGILADKQLSGYQKTQLTALFTELDDSLKLIEYNAGKTGRFNPGIQNQVSDTSKDLIDSTHQIINLLQTDIISGHFSTTPIDFIKITTDLIDKNYAQIFNVLLPTTEMLINARIKRADNELYVTIGIACALLLIAYYFFIGSYYAMKDSVQSLADSARIFAGGDLSERINLGTRDELNQVADSFNEMADGFNALLTTHIEDQQRLRDITNNAHTLIFMKDLSGRYVHVNRLYEQLFHVDNATIQGKTDYDIFPQEQARTFSCNDQQVILSGQPLEIEELVIHDDDIHTYSSVRFPLRRVSGEIYAICGIATDITERKRAETQLRVAATAFETHEAMVITDANTVVLQANHAFTQLTGYTTEELVGHKINVLKSGHHDDAFYASMWQMINRTGTWQGEIWDRRKNGEIYPKWLTITAVKDIDNVVTHFVGTHVDITERKAAEAEIKQLAFYDPLTQLPNRRLLLNRLQQALVASARSRMYCAVMFIDLDNFKTLNDTLGHDKGDLLLQQVADRLTACVRECDTVARLGGDEFVIMLEGLSSKQAEAVAYAEIVGKKILATLNQPYQLADHKHHSTPSIGITLFNNHDKSIDEVVKQADIAMYQSKAAGRNTLRFFESAMQAAVMANLEED